MLMYGWMVWVENAPSRYDWAVKLMTGGRIDQIKKRIAETVEAKDRILDIGCGTGSLGMLCLEKGAHYIGLDSSDYMLEEFRKRADKNNFTQRVELIKGSVTQIGKLVENSSLDAIVSTMAVGEFPREYLDHIFRECRAKLKNGGDLLIADEVWPKKPVARFFYRITMAILWIPQFLILRRAFFPIRDLEGIIKKAGYHVKETVMWPGSTFQLVVAEKRE